MLGMNYIGGVRDTSRAAYEDNAPKFKSMGDRIVAHMKGDPGVHTRAELAQALGVPTATMSGRVNDLLRAKRIAEEPGRFKCGVTGNMVRGLTAA